MADALQGRGIDALFVVGGDGTIRGAQALSAELEKRASPVGVAVVPKTIDNDIPIIDRSFGFDTAVAEAKRAIDTAVVEARSFPRGVGVVRLMGRDAGFLACHAALAAPGDVDAVLVPEQAFDLEGPHGLFAYIDEHLAAKDHAVVVIAEGVAHRLTEDDGSTVTDVGVWLCGKLRDHFKDAPVAVKYVDPSYMVRAVASNAADNILCSRLAAHAVHGVFAGFTEFAVATINMHYALVPLDEFAHRKNLLAVSGRLWQDLVRATGQPTFVANPGLASPGDAACDDDAEETPSGGCVVSY